MNIPIDSQPKTDSIIPSLCRLIAASWFVFLSAFVMVMASERVYWYWAADPDEFCYDILVWWEIAIWYCLPTLAGLLALGYVKATKWHQVVLASALYAFITEGIITPVMYEGGLFDPFMPAMFLGWHGMLAMVGFWFLTRLLIVKRQPWKLALAAVVAGLIFGLWSTTSWLPESAPDPEMVQEDGWSTSILRSGEFAQYALTVGVVFAACHWLLGRAWLADFRPGKASVIPVIALNGMLFIPMAIAIPWAPLKFGFFVGLPLWALHRSRSGNAGPTIFARLAGPTTLADIAPITLMPIIAAAVYAAMTALNPPEEFIRTYVYYTLVWMQVVIGASAFLWAFVKSFRTQPASELAKL